MANQGEIMPADGAPIACGNAVIKEQDSQFVIETGQKLHSATRTFYIVFAAGWGLLFSALVPDFLPWWVRILPLLSVTITAIKTAPRIYRQPHQFFTVQKHPPQIIVVPKTETSPVILRPEDTQSLYVWLSYSGEDRHEAIYHIDHKDQTTILLSEIGDGESPRQIALFLGNLWHKPVLQRDTDGKITTLRRES